MIMHGDKRSHMPNTSRHLVASLVLATLLLLAVQVAEVFGASPGETSIVHDAPPSTSTFPVQLVLDDDSSEGVFGFAGGTARSFLWFNRFPDPGVAFDLEEIWVLFPVGMDVPMDGVIQLAVYLDPDADPGNGANLLATYTETIQVKDGTTFSKYSLPAPLRIDGPGELLIGVINRFFTLGDPPPTQPAAYDVNAGQGRSYFALWSGEVPDPPELTNTLVIDVMDGAVLSNFMIRGFGTQASFADLSISKTDGVTTAMRGVDALTYTIIATNNGPDDDPAVTLTDTFPAELLNCSFAAVASGGATGATVSGSGNLSELLSMPSGSTVTYTVTCDIAATASGTLSNTASISGSVTDPDPANNTATDDDTVIVIPPETDLTISISDSPDPVYPGAELNYSITVSNLGPSASTGSTIVDVLPTGVTFKSSSNCSEAAGTVTCMLGPLAVSASAMVSFVVTVNAGQYDAISNTASITANEVDPVPGNNTATAVTDIIPPPPIPALSAWGLLLLMMLMLAGFALTIRRGRN